MKNISQSSINELDILSGYNIAVYFNFGHAYNIGQAIIFKNHKFVLFKFAITVIG